MLELSTMPELPPNGTLRFFTPKMASNPVVAREIPHSAKNS